MSNLRGARVLSGAFLALALSLASVSCGTADNAAGPESDPTTTTPSVSSTPSPDETESPRGTTPQRRGTTITTASSEFGEVLWGPNRQVVYIWEKEPSTKAACYGDCAAAWPPVLTTGEPVAAGEVEGALLGTTTRRDGSKQVTYDGHPLYYYAHEGPGEVKCHNVATHGGLWWVITPSGQRVA